MRRTFGLLLGSLIGAVPASAEEATITNLLEGGFQIISSNVIPPNSAGFVLRKDKIVMVCVASNVFGMKNGNNVKTDYCRKVE